MSPIKSPANFDTLVELLRVRAAYGSRIAFTFLADGEAEGPHLTYEELEKRARAIGAFLQSQGASGQRALLFYPPGLDFLTAFWGCLFAGVIGVPVFPARLARHLPRLSAIVADSQAKLVLSTSRIGARSEELCKRAPDLGNLQWCSTDNVSLDLAGEWCDPGVDPHTLAFLQYTSGSTGTPRGVMVSHGNLLHNSAAIQRVFGFTPESLGLTWLPHYHDMGLIGCLLQPVYAGCSSVVMPPTSFLQRPLRWLEAVTRYRVTTIVGPNFAYDLCVRKITPEQRATLKLDSIEVALSGAEPVRSQTLNRFAETFAPCGFRKQAFHPAYGLAEATLIVSGESSSFGPQVYNVDAAALQKNSVQQASAEDSTSRALVACGPVVPDTKVVIVDPDSLIPCAPDRVGEIWVSGPGVAQGYWQKPAETVQTFGAHLAGSNEGPFLRTGDLGFLRDGELIINGRMKDLIIIRGANHYSQDLEQTVELSHRALRPGCGAAFSIDAAGEERLVIVYEIEDAEQLAGEEVAEAIRNVLVESHEVSPYAAVLIKPRTIFRTSSGKIQRFACREAFLADKLPVVFQWRQQDVGEDGATAAANLPRSGLVWDYLTTQSSARRPTVSNAAETHGQGAPNGSNKTTQIDQAEPIALIGLGCRFPGAENLQALWRLLREGGDAITEIPPDRWDVDELYDPVPGTPGKMSTRWGGFLKGVDLFDPHFFGISPREASVMDPQQRLLLEITWEALESAGQAPEKLAGSKTGVFVGIGGFDYSNLIINYEQHLERLNAYAGTGIAHSIAANRLSYLLDLRGPSVAMDTACSSSLVAIHLACQSLRTRQSDMALAGGVNLILSPEVTIAFSHARMMASDGRCKTFDARADGYVRGEGCGMVVLKRLSDAVRDRDNILALLKGSSVNQDGRTAGISAPNGLAQQAVIREALAQAGVAPGELSYIEIHGTGTSIGDPIEVEAVKAVLGETGADDPPCLLGSVKANIGHLENASGVAGLAKVVLCLQHGEIPGQLHLNEVNPRISLDNTRISISRKLQPWPSVSRRIAGVNSFGFGGTNAHVTVEEAPSFARSEKSAARTFNIFTLSARTAGALAESAGRYAKHLGEFPAENIVDVCYTANAGRSHFSHRLAVIVESNSQLREALGVFSDGYQTESLEAGHSAKKNGPRVAFLFPGGGSQYVAVARPLFESQPVFRQAVEECAELFAPALDRPLLPLMFPSPAQNRESGISSDRPHYRDAMLFAVEYAIAKLWMSWGIEPDAVTGHGVGEYVAAVIAGAVELPDAVRLVMERARLLPQLAGDTVMSEKLLDEFQASAARVNFQQPRGLFVSSFSGKPLAEGETPDAVYWLRQLQSPIQCPEGIAALRAGEIDLFLEMWPDASLSEKADISMGAGFAADWLPSLHPAETVWRTILQSLGKLYLRGSAVDWDEFDRPYQPHKVFLPTYPFERERYWEDPTPSAIGHASPQDPLLGRQLVSALPTLQFETKLGVGPLRFLRDHRIQGSSVLPASAYLEMALAASLEVFGPGFHSLENVTFHQAALVPEEGTRTVQLTVSPASGGSAMFQIFSLNTDGGVAGWTMHASGEMRMVSPEPPDSSDHQNLLHDIQARCIEKGVGAEFYSALRERGLEYGPAFQGVEWYCRGHQEALAQVSIAAGKNGDLSHYQIHPALLDSCLHALAAAVSKDDASFHPESTYLPTTLAGLRLFSRPGRRLFSHCALRPGSRLGAEFLEADIRLLDEDGHLLGELIGLKVRRVGGEAEPESPREDEKDWLYELAWIPKPATSQPREIESPETGRWLILADRVGLGASLAKLIESRGGTCTLVRSEDSSNGNPFHLDGESYRGVIYLSGLDIHALDGAASSLAAAKKSWLAALHLVQTLVRVPSHQRPRLWMVTRGAQAAGAAPAAIAPAAAPLWGFAKSVDLEHPELRFTRIDLDPAGALDESRLLLEEMSLQSAEREVAYRRALRYVPRLMRRADKTARASGTSIPNASSFRLDTSRPGSFENLILRSASRTAPAPGEVEIQVRAAGLNFRDVMNATGLYPGGPIPFGAECAGTISAVGPNVADLKVGDEVIGVASGSFAAYVTADARAVVRKPTGLGWPEAATIPITFLTAYYGLHRLAGLDKGERVLIHAAAGGVGLAAVQIARRAGAEIFATAGTSEKREYLESLGVQHVMDSRSLAFADEIMRITGGKGVDVVLNSLPGEFAVKSLALLGAYGRFVEIGKTDIYQNKQMGLFPFRNNLSYFACDLERLCRERPVLIRSLFLELMDLFRSGELQPLPLQCFPIEEVAKAFRYMAGRKNLGKVVITFSPVAASAGSDHSRDLRSDSTYLITGGLGSLGLAVALWMVGKGVRNLVLVGRSSGSTYSGTVVRDLQGEGVRVLVQNADISEPSQLTRVLSKVRETMPPVRGIIHAAGVLDDRLLSNLNDESFLHVLAPKIQGAWNLHTQTSALPLDFFVLFSSIASITGSPGQANYAAGNAFLDALAHFRRSQNLRATSINWGPWGEVGMATRQSRPRAVASRAITPIPVTQGLMALDRILETDPIEVVVVSAAWAELARSFGGRESMSLISDLLDDDATSLKEETKEAASKELISRKVLMTLDPAERHALMLAHLQKSLAEVMGLEGATLDPEESLNNLGIDSLMALEVQHSLETSLRLKLPMEILMGMPSLNELSRRLLALLTANERETPQETVRAVGAPSGSLTDPLI